MTWRLVDDAQEVVRKVVQQRRRRLAGRTAGQVARVVLDALAVAELGQHLEIEVRPLSEPLRLEQLAVLVEHRQPLVELGPDAVDRRQQLRPRRHVVGSRVDRQPVELLDGHPAHRIDALDALDLVAPERDPDRGVVVGREDLEHVAAEPEGPRCEVEVGALVLHLGELPEDVVERFLDVLFEELQHAEVGLGRPETVDAAHRGDDEHIAPLEERARRRQPHAVDLLVDRGLLLDVGVGRRHVGLGLVVVVVGDEVLDRVVGEKGPELLVELRRQGLVVAEDQGRAVRRLDDLGHGEGLARAGDAEQRLERHPAVDPLHQPLDGFNLITGRLEFGIEDELAHAGTNFEF